MDDELKSGMKFRVYCSKTGKKNKHLPTKLLITCEIRGINGRNVNQG